MGVALIYFIFVPKEAESPNATFFQKFLIRSGHSLVWILLAVAAAIAYFQYTHAAKLFLWLSLFLYFSFIYSFFKVKALDKKGKK